MKLRMVYNNKKTQLYCCDGSILNVDDVVLRMFCISFKSPSLFSGNDGTWNINTSNIEKAPGKTLAYVSDDEQLCIVNANPFYELISSVGDNEYITLKEYAENHDKGVAIVKRLCDKKEITGAVKKGGCWFIPINAPYPDDKRKRNNTGK